MAARRLLLASPSRFLKTFKLMILHCGAIPAISGISGSGSENAGLARAPMTMVLMRFSAGVRGRATTVWPPMIPATWVPWPSVSVSASASAVFGSACSAVKSQCLSPSGSSRFWFSMKWACELTPVSATAQTIPRPPELKAARAASHLTVRDDT